MSEPKLVKLDDVKKIIEIGAQRIYHQLRNEVGRLQQDKSKRAEELAHHFYESEEEDIPLNDESFLVARNKYLKAYAKYFALRSIQNNIEFDVAWIAEQIEILGGKPGQSVISKKEQANDTNRPASGDNVTGTNEGAD